jgi:hypothetical protein
MSLQQPVSDFATLFLETYTKSGLAWVQTVGCIWCIWGYFTNTRKILWTILFVHALSGLVGIFLENIFIAKKACCSNENWAFLLGFNEVNWVLHESTTVLFSLIKLETIFTSPLVKKVLRAIMIGLLVCFTVFRGMIGFYRVRDNTTQNPAIAQSHSYAFIFWGLADLVIFTLLVQNTIHHMKNSTAALSGLISTLFKSSIPRIFILVVNTLLIVVLGQITNMTSGLSNLNQLAWAIKGTYPIILLIDLQTTKNMLLMQKSTSDGTSTYMKSEHNV